MTTSVSKPVKKLKKAKRAISRAVKVVLFSDDFLSGALSEGIEGHSFLIDPLSGSILS